MRIIVTGLIGQYAFGGVTWDYMQYVLGFLALGHDVWYLEDTSTWAYDPVKQEPSADCSHNTGYLARVMREFDLGDRWIYRNGADGTYHGVDDQIEAEQILASADVLANVSGACWFFASRQPRSRSSSFSTATRCSPTSAFSADPSSEFAQRIAAHERHYSFGLNVGDRDCHVPTCGLGMAADRSASRSRLVEKDPDAGRGGPYRRQMPWTTVMTGASYAPKDFAGRAYGQKDIEFGGSVDLPSLTSEKIRSRDGPGGRTPPDRNARKKGWKTHRAGCPYSRLRELPRFSLELER